MTKEQEAAVIIARLFQFALQNPDRIIDARGVLAGDLSGLYSHEEKALLWLAEYWKENPKTFISSWTADYVRAVLK